MVHGPMAEAQQGFAILEDVDQGTFLRFVEWLYHGFYHPAKPCYENQPEAVSHNAESAKAEGSANSQSRSPADEVLVVDVALPATQPDPVDFGGWESFSRKKRRASPKERFIQRTYSLHVA